QKVALVTDGRMSGASGKILAAIHVTPEALNGGQLARIVQGDVIRVDAHQGTLDVKLASEVLDSRHFAPAPAGYETGTGRELFALMRRTVGPADRGASYLFED
ncbi:MAG: dihydroxy-acid dehydratase, partial [Steroidobacteraceae bacterium]